MVLASGADGVTLVGPARRSLGQAFEDADWDSSAMCFAEGVWMTARVLPVRNPRTGEVDHEIAAAGTEEVILEATRLREHQRAWSDLGIQGRIEVMQRWLTEFGKQAARFGELEAIDTGGTHTSYLQGFITMANIKGWIEDAEASLEAATIRTTSATMPTVEVTSQLVPYPLVGIISPWNAPAMLGLIDAIPALFAGSAVLWKPSEITPRFVPACV
jgi:succinate-semialdehyde dehydrogenase / glutarate-semialdehyde dehydrogenase